MESRAGLSALGSAMCLWILISFFVVVEIQMSKAFSKVVLQYKKHLLSSSVLEKSKLRQGLWFFNFYSRGVQRNGATP